MPQNPGPSGSQLDNAVVRAKAKIAAKIAFPAACYQPARECGIDSFVLMAEMRKRSAAHRRQSGRQRGWRAA